MRTVLKGLMTAAVVTICSTSAFAGSVMTLGFKGVTNYNECNTQIGESQFKVKIENLGNKVSFKFQNTGPKSSSIMNVFFDTPRNLLGSLCRIDEPRGVDFKGGSWLSNLPGGRSIGFRADAAAQSKGITLYGKERNGVNACEWVTLTYQLCGSFEQLTKALETKSFRIGVFASGFKNCGVESFVNECPPVHAVPTPSAAAAGLVGLGIAAMRRRK